MITSIKGIDVYYESFGSGLPIVMIHGWGPDHRILKFCMEPIFQHFPFAFRRVYLDLPGMGKTKGAPWIDCSDRMLEVLLSFIDRVVPDRDFLVVGESYGGYLARGVAAKESARVSGLCLLCPIAKQETQRENAPPFRVLEREEGLDGLLDADDRKYFETISVKQSADVLFRFREGILPGLKSADFDFLGKCLGKAVPFSWNVDDPKRRYDFPALFLAGRQDSSVGYADLWKIVELYTRASFCVLDKAGHNLQIEQPELFGSLVREWLERVLYERTAKGKAAGKA
jgi:pimeloyl-ACP methyl ester carboxylesterase